MDANQFERERFIAERAVRDAAVSRAEEFTEYVLDTAGVTVTADNLDRDAVTLALRELHHAGYAVDYDDEPAPVGFASLPDYHQLLRDVEVWANNVTSQLGGVGYLDVDEVRFYGARELPEGTLIALHPEATAPTYPANDNRPWIITDPDGVVRVEVVG